MGTALASSRPLPSYSHLITPKMNTATNAMTASPASAPPPLVLKPSYSPPTDPGAMAPRLQGDDKDNCPCDKEAEDDLPYCSLACECQDNYEEDNCMVCGKPAEDGLPFCSLACECHAKYEEDQQWQEYQAYQAAKMKEAQQAQAVEHTCVVCGREAEDGLHYCCLACECRDKYDDDVEWQKALEAKAKAQAQNH